MPTSRDLRNPSRRNKHDSLADDTNWLESVFQTEDEFTEVLDNLGNWVVLIVLSLFVSGTLVICGPYVPTVAAYVVGNWLKMLRALPPLVWVLTPFIAALLWAGCWYLNKREAYDRAQPQRGRRVLSGSAARQSAERQLGRRDGPPSKLRTRM